MEVKSSLPVCVLQLLFFGAGDMKRVHSFCILVYHMFEFHQEQRLLKIT